MHNPIPSRKRRRTNPSRDTAVSPHHQHTPPTFSTIKMTKQIIVSKQLGCGGRRGKR
jgi:hypothetical protein